MDLAIELEYCNDFGEIFSLVKKAVEKSLGEHRVGLMLYLGNLPMKVGAFHFLETNDIVLNRRLLNKISKEKSLSERRAFIFSILLHEYLHSLGYIKETEVRGLVYQICAENFGKNHYVTEAAFTGPWSSLTEGDLEELGNLDLELIKDFEHIDHGYII